MSETPPTEIANDAAVAASASDTSKLDAVSAQLADSQSELAQLRAQLSAAQKTANDSFAAEKTARDTLAAEKIANDAAVAALQSDKEKAEAELATKNKADEIVAVDSEKEAHRNELVSVFNHSPKGGDFVHHVYVDMKNGDGIIVSRKVAVEWRVPGRSFGNVPRWIAELWMKQSPAYIVDGQQMAQGATASPVSSERIAAVETENNELKTRLANMEKMMAELQKKSTSQTE